MEMWEGVMGRWGVMSCRTALANLPAPPQALPWLCAQEQRRGMKEEKQ